MTEILTSHKFACIIARILDEKIAKDISILNVANVCFVTFIIQHYWIKVSFFYAKSWTCSIIDLNMKSRPFSLFHHEKGVKTYVLYNFYFSNILYNSFGNIFYRKARGIYENHKNSQHQEYCQRRNGKQWYADNFS